VLYGVVQAQWHTFVQRVTSGERVVPRFCVREVEGFMRCGILGYGFARVHCARCKQDDVVAFSSKGRGRASRVRPDAMPHTADRGLVGSGWSGTRLKPTRREVNDLGPGRTSDSTALHW